MRCLACLALFVTGCVGFDASDPNLPSFLERTVGQAASAAADQAATEYNITAPDAIKQIREGAAKPALSATDAALAAASAQNERARDSLENAIRSVVDVVKTGAQTSHDPILLLLSGLLGAGLSLGLGKRKDNKPTNS